MRTSSVVSNSPLTTPPSEDGGHLVNEVTAMVYAYLNRAALLVADGYALGAAIDTAMRLGCGLPAGPLRTLDEIGLDTVHRALSDLHASTGNDCFRPAGLLTELVCDGALGRKSGRGFFDYQAQDGRPTDSAAGVTVRSSQVKTVGVVGSGTMAKGIAEAAIVAGFPTAMVARSAQKAETAAEAVAASLAKAVRRGRRTSADRESALRRLRCGSELTGCCECDLVIEAVAEEPEIKREVFGRLGVACRPGALLATTTSSLSVAECAAASGRPADVLGLHFFNPAPVMRLVELVRADATADRTAEGAAWFCEQLGKTTVVCGDRAGFIVNFLLFPYLADAVRLLDRHLAEAIEIDMVVEQSFGYPMGPFALLDTIGLDVSMAILARLREAFPGPAFEPPRLLAEMVARGDLGRKTGRGFRCEA